MSPNCRSCNEHVFAAKKAKRQAQEGPKKDIEVEKKLDESIPIDLNFLTNPDKK